MLAFLNMKIANEAYEDHLFEVISNKKTPFCVSWVWSRSQSRSRESIKLGKKNWKKKLSRSWESEAKKLDPGVGVGSQTLKN